MSSTKWRPFCLGFNEISMGLYLHMDLSFCRRNLQIDGLVQDSSISSAFAMEILQSCAKLLKCLLMVHDYV